MYAGERIRCRRLVITTGTFLRGVIHIGSQSRPAGRMPSTAASDAAAGSAAPAAAAQATHAADESAALAAGMPRSRDPWTYQVVSAPRNWLNLAPAQEYHFCCTCLASVPVLSSQQDVQPSLHPSRTQVVPCTGQQVSGRT